MKGSLTITKEKEKLEPFTKPESVQPERKGLKEDMLEMRIVVISPYGPINTFFETEIPRINQACCVDIVSHAERKEVPYIKADEREKNKQVPYLIIDFWKIIAFREKEVIDEAKRISERMQTLSELICGYADSIAKGKVLDSEVYKREQSPADLQRKITIITKGLVDILEVKLGKYWKMADDMAIYRREVEDIAEFKDYGLWASKRRVNCVVPKEGFALALEKQVKYDEDGNFMPNAFDIKEYVLALWEDTRELLRKESTRNLKLFWYYNEYC